MQVCDYSACQGREWPNGQFKLVGKAGLVHKRDAIPEHTTNGTLLSELEPSIGILSVKLPDAPKQPRSEE